MELNIGVIRDRQGIYSGLLESQSMHRQLAVCYNSGGALLVKMSVVSEIISESGNITIVLQSSLDPLNKTAVSLDQIQSIYPITDYIG